MWDAARDGSVYVIGSDTAGHMLKTKDGLRQHLHGGLRAAGQETMFMVTYDEGFNRRGASLPRPV